MEETLVALRKQGVGSVSAKWRDNASFEEVPVFEGVSPHWRPTPRIREVGIVEVTLPFGASAPHFYGSRRRRPRIVGYADVRAPMCASCQENWFRRGCCADPECCKRVATTYGIRYPRLRRRSLPTEGREFRVSSEERNRIAGYGSRAYRGGKPQGRKPRRLERWAERFARAHRSD